MLYATTKELLLPSVLCNLMYTPGHAATNKQEPVPPQANSHATIPAMIAFLPSLFVPLSSKLCFAVPPSKDNGSSRYMSMWARTPIKSRRRDQLMASGTSMA